MRKRIILTLVACAMLGTITVHSLQVANKVPLAESLWHISMIRE